MIIISLYNAYDEAIYAYLSKTQPDGNIMMTDTEQSELMNRLRRKVTKR